jgi:hypothetical protein
VVGETNSDAHAGVTGRNLTSRANGGVGVYGTGGQYGGKFDGLLVNGNHDVTGTLTVKTDIVLAAPSADANMRLTGNAGACHGRVLDAVTAIRTPGNASA